MSNDRSTRAQIWAPYGVAFGFWGVFLARGLELADGTWYYSLFDDAMISMRYAQNAAAGEGLVWNVGEPAVEGYTNFLWTLWMTVLHAVGLPPSAVALAVALSGAVLLGATMVVVHRLAERTSGGDQRVVLGTLWLFATFYPLAFWALRGMEVGLVAFVLAATVLLLLDLDRGITGRRLAFLALLGTVGVLTRPDTAAFLVVIGVLHLATHPRHRRVPVLVAVLGVPLAVFGAHTLLRWRWYGELVPITYELKVGGTSMFERGARGGVVVAVSVLGQLVVSVAGAVVALQRSSGRQRAAVVTLVSPFVASIGYCVWTGGDAWEWMNFANRFLAATMPTLFVAASLGAVALADQLSTKQLTRALGWSAGVLLVFAGLSALQPLPTSSLLAEQGSAASMERAVVLGLGAVLLLGVMLRTRDAPPAQRPARFLRGVLVVAIVTAAVAPVWQWVPTGGREMLSDKRTARMGALLAGAVPPDTSIGVVHAGNLVYFSGLPGVDLLGKNDPAIAQSDPKIFYPGHGKWDFEHSIVDLRPAIVLELVSGYSAADRVRLAELGYEELPGDVWVDPLRVDPDAVRQAIVTAGWDGPEVSGT